MQSNGTEYLNNHKMNAFFKTFFASLLAVVAGGILFAVLGVMVLVGIGVSALSGNTAAVCLVIGTLLLTRRIRS